MTQQSSENTAHQQYKNKKNNKKILDPTIGVVQHGSHITNSHISVVYSTSDTPPMTPDTAHKISYDVPQTQTTFIPWRWNVTAVQFGNSVVYSPKNAENFAIKLDIDF